MKKFFFSGCLLFLPFIDYSQNDSVFKIESLPEASGSYADPSFPLNKYWKFCKGDDMRYADTAFDDSKWIYIPPDLPLKTLPENTFENIGWFRLHLEIDSSLLNKALALMITQSGASEIYLDGKLIHSFGKINPKNPLAEERYDPQLLPVNIKFEKTLRHVLAVRYSCANALVNFKNKTNANPGFEMKIGKLWPSIEYNHASSIIVSSLFIFYFTFFFALSLLHFIFFLFYRTNKSNLYYSIFALGFGGTFLWLSLRSNVLDPDAETTLNYLQSFLPNIYMPALIAMLQTIFLKRFTKTFWIVLALFALDFITTLLHFDIPYLGFALMQTFAIMSLWIIVISIIKKRDGSWIIGSGVIVTVLLFGIFIVLAYLGRSTSFFVSANGWKGLIIGILMLYATISIPLSMSIYLARDFSRTSRNLQKKLIEVEELSIKTIEQEKEKQKILETQKEVLETQVKERTAEIVEQKKVIEEKNKDITDSINYARRIQNAIRPSSELVQKIFPDSFALYKPKDIVSGDFYFYEEINARHIVACADCTGHGVPGAFMSLIGHNLLSQIIKEKLLSNPAEILHELHQGVRQALKQDSAKTESKDGMDIAILTFNFEKSELEYAGAQRPLWIIRNGNLEEIKPDKFSIGGLQTEEKRNFNNHIIKVQKGDCFYMTSDGFADQFGGTDGKKFMTKRFKQLIVSIHQKPMLEQWRVLTKTIEEWKGNKMQVDDILVIGIRI